MTQEEHDALILAEVNWYKNLKQGDQVRCLNTQRVFTFVMVFQTEDSYYNTLLVKDNEGQLYSLLTWEVGPPK